MIRSLIGISLGISFISISCSHVTLRGTNDLGAIVEREKGNLLIVDTTQKEKLTQVTGLGDLSHASLVYSKDGRFAFVFGRDGGLTKIDILTGKIQKRVVQAGNSIGGAISQDGSLVAVSNYVPGGVKIFKTSDLSLVADIPALAKNGKNSKVVGLVDAPDNKFICSLFEASEIWTIDMTNIHDFKIQKFFDIGKEPYDALITPDGRFYIAGLFGEDGLALVDLWHPEKGVRKILENYGKGQEKLPVFKMPHFEGWAISGSTAFVPAVGHHEIIVVDLQSWKEIKRIPVHGQPVFAMANPNSRQVWVNFALPNNDAVQVIDTDTMTVIQTLKPGKAVLHMEFTPKGENIWLSVRDENRIDVYSTQTLKKLTTLSADHPSGIFFTNRAGKIGL